MLKFFSAATAVGVLLAAPVMGAPSSWAYLDANRQCIAAASNQNGPQSPSQYMQILGPDQWPSTGGVGVSRDGNNAIVAVQFKSATGFSSLAACQTAQAAWIAAGLYPPADLP
jgi:hypothetical protein